MYTDLARSVVAVRLYENATFHWQNKYVFFRLRLRLFYKVLNIG